MKPHRQIDDLRPAFAEKWLGPDSSVISLKQVFGGSSSPWRKPAAITALPHRLSARLRASWSQVIFGLCLVVALGCLATWQPALLLKGLYALMWAAFMGNALFRLGASLIKPTIARTEAGAVNENLPAYSVIIALYKEAEIVPQFLQAMMALDYPRDRLEILFALEADDLTTVGAFEACHLPGFARIIKRSAIPAPNHGP
jgi:hypothetical protein